MYEFITIGGGEFFVDIFNGLAMVLKSGDFAEVVKIAGTISFAVVMINVVLSGNIYDAGKWYLTTFVILQALLYPSASVHVTDKANPTLQGAKIDNVPYVIALTASTTSQVGYALTKQLEAVYSLPDDIQYSQNGMLFGANLLQALTKASVTNSNLASSLDSFSQNCIFYDTLLGMYSYQELKSSEDIWGFIKDKQVENRFFTYTDKNGVTTYPTCKEGAAKIDADWQSEYQSQDLLADLGIRSSKPNLTKAVLSSATPLINQYFFDTSYSSDETLRQAMMINAINSAVENYEAENQVQSYQNARASLQTRSTYKTMGVQAGIWIPMLKIIIESVFYAAFPLVILVSLLPGMTGPVLRSYFTTFFWLAAWGPLYAILHRISMGQGTLYTLGFNGLTLSSQQGVQETMSDIGAMAGYMSFFVPMLAFGIARGGAAAMSSMATSFMAGVQSSVSAAAYEGSTGNINLGNSNIGAKAIHSGFSMQNDQGQIIRYNNDGSTSINNANTESNFGFNIHGSDVATSSLSNQISNEQSLAQTKSVQSAITKAHGFEMMINDNRTIENSKDYQNNFTQDQREAFSEITRKNDEFAIQHNISKEKSAEIFAGIAAGIGINAKASASDQELYNEAQHFAKENNLSKEFATVESAMESNRFNISNTKGESINESFNKSASLSREAGEHFEKARRYNEELSYVKSHSAEIDRSYNQEFWQDLVGKYGTSRAAEIVNPSSANKSVLDHEINDFFNHKTQQLENVKNPNLEGIYNRNSDSFTAKHDPDKSSNLNPYNFSSDFKKVDNSHLQDSVSKQISNTKQTIDEAKIDSSVKESVQSEQDKGTVNRVIDNSLEAGKEVLSDARTALQELKMQRQEKPKKEEDGE